MSEKIETLLKQSRTYQPSAKTKAAAYIQDYETEYKKSIADPEAFGAESPRNSNGLRRGTKCWNGTTPSPNGSSARPATSPTTALTAM